ncbi:MAG: BAX inhibitor (BI)-1/YccA family protein [Legionellales bacterium]|nr:BAX inhibitor (BI)-1/YccA family protein [Legionellales bacterium]
MNQLNVQRGAASVIEINKVLRNTYLLLGMTLLFSALTAGLAIFTQATPLNPILAIVGMYGLLFLTQAMRNSALGLVCTFAFTGFMGYIMGPLLSYYLTAFSNGSELIMTALGATGIIFFALSGYVMTSRKDFSYLSGFLFVGIIVAFLAMIASFFLAIPGLQLAVSAAFALISSGLILFQTSAIIHGGERNYIMATITLYVSIYNLFLSLLNLFAAFSGRD